MQDEQIVDLYWKRSEEAIRETDKKYGKYCGTIAWNILYSAEDAEECVNDTWMNAWNAMPPHRPGFLKAFLGKITRNLALNLYEKKHAEKRGGGETALALDELAECVGGVPGGNGTAGVSGSVWDSEGSPEEGMVLTACLNRFLQSMKAEDRKIFVQRYWYMYSVKEIAGNLGLGESKVKMTLLRQREKLKKVLEEEGIPV